MQERKEYLVAAIIHDLRGHIQWLLELFSVTGIVNGTYLLHFDV
ncbi:hypothetical protein BVRB_2g035380 [Beta vulgaris subsp. vulgaris]|nr:hypothetical protein BVRB_2g035380 [Beta vulgaris subsp. vulgaris]